MIPFSFFLFPRNNLILYMSSYALKNNKLRGDLTDTWARTNTEYESWVTSTLLSAMTSLSHRSRSESWRGKAECCSVCRLTTSRTSRRRPQTLTDPWVTTPDSYRAPLTTWFTSCLRSWPKQQCSDSIRIQTPICRGKSAPSLPKPRCIPFGLISYVS